MLIAEHFHAEPIYYYDQGVHSTKHSSNIRLNNKIMLFASLDIC